MASVEGVEVLGESSEDSAAILTADALQFVATLQREFNARRKSLLAARQQRQADIRAGKLPDFLSETADVRSGDWKVAPHTADLEDRRVEITGPCDRKMMINAFNSGANGFMADLEDALSPTWANVIGSQVNLKDAVRGTLDFTSKDGKQYQLAEKVATLLVRPRGWHLDEKHVRVDGELVSASLFDFGLYFFHNAEERVKRGTGPYFYLPKLESHLEARLWNDVFNFAQDKLSIPRGTIRATVLIETILAAFEMEEILYELRDHSAGLNAGRWDYIFSSIKKFSHSSEHTLPDRSQITMTVPFMRAYTELLVRACHRRGAHAMGGMAAFIPSRKDPEINKVALAKVAEDKQREANDGFDGTWIAHPDLVTVARAEFDKVLGGKPNQKERLREEVNFAAADLINLTIPGGKISENGLRNNISVGLQYVEAWLRGLGAVGIYNLMEDTATAEISRAQLWQWVHNGAELDDGRKLDKALYESVRDEELAKLGGVEKDRYQDAVTLLDAMVLTDSFPEFLTLPAYEYLS